ncbi:hypothetical protein ACFQ61_26920, partial [Streptomyces sp. NPDC056500]|uniref:hypothetical protein n=1 Tax=Streptomyces sp. NPDC056500 TaxID=3345840 RepID=UPI0036CE4E5E
YEMPWDLLARGISYGPAVVRPRPARCADGGRQAGRWLTPASGVAAVPGAGGQAQVGIAGERRAAPRPRPKRAPHGLSGCAEPRTVFATA